MSTPESLQPGPQLAEELLQDPDIQTRLQSVFAELDNLYAGISEHTPHERTPLGGPSITADGTYIEAGEVALPLPNKQDSPVGSADREAKVDQHHASKELLVFAFNLADLRNPGFQLRPLLIDPKNVSSMRGGGIDIFMADASDPKPEFDRPLNEELGSPDDKADYPAFEEYLNKRSTWRRRNIIHLPQGDYDSITYRGEATEPFRTVRERAGVDL